MEKENKGAHFGSSPSLLKVPAHQKGSFEIGFVPNLPGRYFQTFTLKLFGEPVETFSVVGIGFDKENSKTRMD